MRASGRKGSRGLERARACFGALRSSVLTLPLEAAEAAAAGDTAPVVGAIAVGAWIRVQSQVGQGSTFAFTLPLQPDARSSRADPHLSSLPRFALFTGLEGTNWAGAYCITSVA